MAIRILTANATLSTSAGSWKKAEAGVFTLLSSSNAIDDTNTARTSATFTVTNGVSLQGAFVMLKKLGTTGTYTVALMEGATQRAISATLNVTDLTVDFGWVYVAFGTPYTASSGINYSIKITCNTASRLSWGRSSTAGDYNFAIIGNGDDTTKIASGDVALIKNGVTLTVDESLTLGISGQYCLLLGDNSTFSVPAPSSAITIALGSGTIFGGSNYLFKVGSSASRVTTANKVTITSTKATSGIIFETPYTSYVNKYFGAFELWGAKSSALYVHAAADAAAGQAVITTTEAIPASWVNGDTVTIVGKDIVTNVGTLTYTITKGSNQVTLSSNLDYAVLAGAAICNQSEAARNLGIVFQNTNYPYIYTTGLNVSTDHVNFEGVYFDGVIPTTAYDSNATQTAVSTVDSIYFHSNSPNISAKFTFGSFGATFNNVVMINDQFSYNPCKIALLNSNVTGLVIRGFGGTTGSPSITGNNIVFSDFILVGQTSSSFTGASISGSVIYINGGLCVGASYFTGGPYYLTSWKQNRSHSGTHGVGLNNAFFNASNCTFGISSGNPTADIRPESSAYTAATLTNCNIGSTGVINTSNAINGSFVRFINYNGTVGDYRSWYKYGTFTSSGSSIVEISASGTNPLINTLNLSSQTIASKKFFLSVGCLIGNSAYYGGVYVLPKMVINYDTSSTATSTATATTAQQSLQQIFTPATSNNNLIVQLKCQTDASAPNNKVTFSNLTFSQRNYGYTFVDTVLPIAQTTDAVLATLTTPISNPFISQANQATVDAYSGISIDGSGNITLTTNHSVNELYDYCQSYFSKDANGFSTNPFTTTDGQTFTMAKNLTVTNCDLTGTSTQVLAMGSNTLTTTGTGRVLMVYSTVSGKTGLLALSGLSGHSVYLADNLGAQVDYQASVTGTYYKTIPVGSTGTWTWITAKYGQTSATNTFTATGGGVFAFTPAQIPDGTIIELDPAVVAAYTTLETLDKFHDYLSYYVTTNAGIVYGTIHTNAGATLNLLANDLDINATAGSVFSYNGSKITIKASDLDAGTYESILVTSGTVALLNGSTISIVYTDAAGNHVKIVAANILSGSRVQLYDVTNSVELYNDVLGSAGLTFKILWSGDRTIRLRTMKIGYLASEDTGILTASGLTFLTTQTVDDIYVANAVDGSTVTEYVADYPSIQVDVSDGDGTTTVQRLYAWWQYNLTSSQGIANYVGGLIAEDSANYRIVTAILDLFLQNVGAIPTILVGARLYRDDDASIFVNGSAPFQADPGKAYLASGGGSTFPPTGDFVNG